MSWFSRLRHAVNPRRLDQELADELQEHLERKTEELIAQGLAPKEAMRAARRAFGNVDAIREQSRDIKLVPVLETTLQDLRYACRTLVRRPVFAVSATLTLGLATGASLAIYTLVNATVFQALPVGDADQLVAFLTSGPAAQGPGGGASRDLFSYPLYEEIKADAVGAADIALLDDPHRAEVQSDRGDAASDDIVSQFVSPDLFAVLRVPPALGQLFSPADADRRSTPRLAVVLSHDYWTHRFGADRSAVGRTLLLDGRPHEVVGVAPPGFHGVEPGTFVDVWRPITTFDPSVFTNAGFRSFRLIARLEPGTSPTQLLARLQTTYRNHVAGRIRTGGPSLSATQETALRSTALDLSSARTGVSAFKQTFSRPLWILLGLAASMLVLAAANVAGLLLARSRARASEVTLRLALGASPGRLVRQFLVEAAVIATVAIGVGWLIAQLSMSLIVQLVSTSHAPVRLELGFDRRVLPAVLAAYGLIVVLVGAVPAAWATRRSQWSRTVRTLGRQVTHAGIGQTFVGIQVAFEFCLVVTSAAFLLTLRNLTHVDLGFRADNVTVLTIANSLGPSQRPLQMQLTHDLQTRVAALPGVQDAATAWWAMFTGARRAQHVSLPGEPVSASEVLFYRVSPHYLATVRVPLLSGRDLDSRDNDDEPVPTVISLAFARQYFQNDSPLGRVFLRDDGVRHEAVGVAGDARYDGLRGTSTPIVYMPMKPPNVFTLYVRSPAPPIEVANLVARETAALGFGLRVRDVTPLSTLIDDTIVTERVLAALSAGSAALGLVLAAIGLFGLLNYAVTERTQEFGIRAALGARRHQIYVLVMQPVLAAIVIGLSVGAATAWLLIRAARGSLFGVAQTDPIVIGLALAVFVGAAAIACAFPTRRAARIDPIKALRHE